MKKVLYTLLAIFIGFSFAAKAQPDSILSVYANNYQEERIYIHFDKSSYLPGETIWFKAYLMQGVEPSNFSKNFYLEFANAAGQVVHYFTAPIVYSSAKGMFTLPNNFKAIWMGTVPLLVTKIWFTMRHSFNLSSNSIFYCLNSDK